MLRSTPKRLSAGGWLAVLVLAALLPVLPAPAPARAPDKEKAAPQKEESTPRSAPAVLVDNEEPITFRSTPMTLHPAPLPCESAVLSRDGTLLATAHGWSQTAGETRIWDVKTGQARFVFREPRGVRTVAFSPDGTLLAAGDFSDLIKIYDVAKGTPVSTLRG